MNLSKYSIYEAVSKVLNDFVSGNPVQNQSTTTERPVLLVQNHPSRTSRLHPITHAAEERARGGGAGRGGAPLPQATPLNPKELHVLASLSTTPYIYDSDYFYFIYECATSEFKESYQEFIKNLYTETLEQKACAIPFLSGAGQAS